jgi:geranyl-CoA carboxylase alpha subunit
MPRLRHILVANRGEIAVRVIRTARALGYRTTAVYSQADSNAPHVKLADAAFEIGPATVGESYLSIPRVLEAARLAGADAVHPGYGLLSENAGFAQACADAGLTFIGPSPATIALMGDKRRARVAMQAAGVQCVPGYDGEDQSDDTLATAADSVGFPLMVKAAAGGGGRGMRRVEASGELREGIARARSEAQKAFGDDRLILERAIDGARHVEVQIVADAHGHVVHLGERDCSVQRRFQKVIEEAPSPAVDDAMRTRMGELGVLAARASGYVGIGTVEMLLSGTGEVFFLEMNTRIQVEHPVTELVTGLDLVALQLAIAEGQALPFTQADVQLRGHAIEARLYAEDATRGYLPATGRVMHLSLPEGEGLRVDHALAQGLVIGPHYDPMLAKVIAFGDDREQARRRLLEALRELELTGVTTNRDFLRAVLAHPEFVAATVTTDFLDRRFELPPSEPVTAHAWLAASEQATRRGMPKAQHGELTSFTNAVGLDADIPYAPRKAEAAVGSGRALSPMDGTLVEVSVQVGDRVSRGQTLAVVEAMKLELRVTADVDGTVKAVHATKGAQVRARQVLVEVE